MLYLMPTRTKFHPEKDYAPGMLARMPAGSRFIDGAELPWKSYVGGEGVSGDWRVGVRALLQVSGYRSKARYLRHVSKVSQSWNEARLSNGFGCDQWYLG